MGFWIAIAFGVLVVLFIVVSVIRTIPPDEDEEMRKGKRRTQELMSTPEGRQWLADRIGSSFKDLKEGDEPKWKPCPACEGYGKLGHRSRIIKGAKVEFTPGTICPTCGGTGIEGGLDYENVECPACEGKGAVGIDPETGVGAKCIMCQGTKVIARDKV